MIASVEHGFCFIHIPKNGGSTIRDQLADMDSLNGSFHGRVEIDGFGRQQKAHLPLPVIRQHFPDVFALIEPLQKIVIVREPADRFISAMSQRSREVHKKFLNELSEEQIREDFDIITKNLNSEDVMPAHEFRHFCRQKDYAYIDGSRFVEHIVPLERMPDLIAFLSERTGRRLDPKFHSNKTVSFRNEQVKARLLKVKSSAKRVLPTIVYGRAKDLGLRIFAKEGSGYALETLRSAGLYDFVRSFYAQDHELLADARENQSMKAH